MSMVIAKWLFRHLLPSKSKNEIDSAKKKQEIPRFMIRHLAGYKDGTGTFCCYGKSRRQPDRPLAAERPNTGRSMRTD